MLLLSTPNEEGRRWIYAQSRQLWLARVCIMTLLCWSLLAGLWFPKILQAAPILFLTVRPCKPLKVMYVRGGQTCFGGFWGKKSYRDVR
jgi:hypothetical protein